jgi:N-methylhydantoinase A/oxoprolinase/acetone carboxylase beta subunit
MYRIGVDIGGTFTDFALHDAQGRRMAIYKRLTTPADPSQAVLDGVQAICRQNNVPIAAVTEIVHGTTLVTNAAGDGRLLRHHGYGLRAPLRPIRPAHQVPPAAGTA